MRIIGKGRDYYDGVMAYGSDKELVFMRFPQSEAEHVSHKDCGLKRPPNKRIRIRKLKNKNGRISECYFICVLFAGKRYGGVEVPLEREQFFSTEPAFAWSLEGLQSLLTKHGYEMVDHDDRGDDEFSRYAGMTTIEAHFKDEITPAETKWLIENGKSIAIWSHHYSRISDPRSGWLWTFDCDGLKEIDFAKALDPYSAFQSLSQWVGGTLPRKDKETIQLSDAQLAKKRGYNHWSFRKPPQAKR